MMNKFDQTEKQNSIIEELKNENKSQQFMLLKLQYELNEKELIQKKTKEELENIHLHYRAAMNELQTIRGSTFWKMTKPARYFVDGVKSILRASPITRLIYKGVWSLRHHGARVTFIKTKLYFNKRGQFNINLSKILILDEVERERQKNIKFSNDVKISLLVPLYNTSETFLREMIESVINQTYSNWELCLADGSDLEHSSVERICKEIADRDNRIIYKKLSFNGGISYNTNKAIEMASGEYVGLLDHDDLLHPSLLFEIMQMIDLKNADFIYTDEMTFEGVLSKPVTIHYKPDFAIDNLRANNYICHFSCFSRELLNQAGHLRSECDGSQDYDIVLRLTELAEMIVHIPKLLYFWRSHPGSVASAVSVKPYCIEAAKLAISDHLKRSGLRGSVTVAPHQESIYRIKYELNELPLISIIIPNKDNKKLLVDCIESIIYKSTYKNWEIIVIENNSKSAEIHDYYKELESKERIRVLKWNKGFNFSAINNYGASSANGQYLLFLNNDTKVITPEWIEEMLMYAQRNDVGAVGAMLYFPNNTVQHAGVAIDPSGSAGHVFYTVPKDSIGYMGRLCYVQNYSAVTAACLMVRRELFEKVKGFDEELAVAYNDVDFCLKLREIGKLNIFTPFAELYHFESVSRGSDQEGENLIRWKKEEELFKMKWNEVIKRGDPYFNPNFKEVNNYTVVSQGGGIE